MTTPPLPIIISSRYRILDSLGSGGMGTVYRTLDRLTGQTVAVKQVLSAARDLGSDDYSSMLAREFKVLASLRHPHIISVLDYGFDPQRQPYYVMPLLESTRDLLMEAGQCDLDGKIGLLLQVLQALAYLHRRGILHRDLKPANVLIDAQAQVKLVDFGLAVSVDEENRPAGTMSYMAPEVLNGKRSGVPSDLYAFGVIAYEMLAGRRPFNASSPISLMYKALHEPLDVQALSVSCYPELMTVVQKLLAPAAADRYASAEEVIQAICAATGQPLALETHATRESFLQASQFIGRDAEIEMLTDALNRAKEGGGSAWIVGGESGVGKSRLLDEAQTQALLNGALVLRGQAIAEGGLPYQMWRDPIRRLSLQTDLTDSEAGVLKPLVPDLDRLLGREIPDTPEINTQAMQLRLLSAIDSMFYQQRQLIVLLLEDLQWAEDSIAVLRRLSGLAKGLPLLIIGTYRNDERPDLPVQLPMMQSIKLERLSDAAIERLSVSMLGEGGKSKGLVELLKQETEGNVFFVVEVVRALAEEAGGLANVGLKTLPEHVFAGGMETVIRRRIDKVPESARRLMTIAAVVGRELDLTLLACIMPSVNLDNWLQQVATVIEVQDNRYRFAHDKLREGILNRLTPEDRRPLHREIAEALEATYPDSPEQYAALAYHWGQVQDAAKTVKYATLAGKEALRSGGYRDATQFFKQALLFSKAAQVDSFQLGNLNYLLGDAYWGQSELIKSYEAHVVALRLLGFSVPEAPLLLLLGSVKPLLRHVWRHIFHPPPRKGRDETLIVAAAAFHDILIGSYQNSNLRLGLYSIFTGMDAAERAGDSPEAIRLKVRNYISFAFAMNDISLHALSRPYVQLAERYLRMNDDPEMRAWHNCIYGTSLVGRGQWDKAHQMMVEALRLSKAAGSLGLWINLSEALLGSYYLQGQLAEALTLIRATNEVVVRDGHLREIGRMHVLSSRILFMQGHVEQARKEYFDNEALIQEALSLGDQSISKANTYSLLIDLYSTTGDHDVALKYADMLNSLLRKAQTLSFVLAWDAATPIGLYLALWEKQGNAAHRQPIEKMLHLYHSKFTHHYEIGQPIESMYRCWYHWLAGNEPQARKNGALAIQTAQAYKMAYCEALARYHLARFMPKDDPERADHLARALKQFQEIGADHDAERVSDVL